MPTPGQKSGGLGKVATASLMFAVLTLTSCPHQAKLRASDVMPASPFAAARAGFHVLLERVTGAADRGATRATELLRASAVSVTTDEAGEPRNDALGETRMGNGAPGDTLAGSGSASEILPRSDAPGDAAGEPPPRNDVSSKIPAESGLAGEPLPRNDAPGRALLHAAPALHRPFPDAEAEREIPLVYSIGRETWIFAEPRFSAKQLGYLRFGARTQRSPELASRQGCSTGWYAIKPTGYVCANGRTATVDGNHPLVKTPMVRPNRTAALPFLYTKATHGIPRYFGHAPSDAERPRGFSKRLASQLGQVPIPTLPDWLRRSRQVFGYQRFEARAALGDGLVGSGVALLGLYSDSGTLYGITPDLELVTTDGLEAVRPSTFVGVTLSEAAQLPIAFAMHDSVWLYQGHPNAAQRTMRRLLRRESVAMSEERVEVQGQQWWRTKAGEWLRSSAVRAIPRRSDFPEWARDGQVWVDVSINQQTLVAYDGQRAVYATLVSTGVDGLLDPATSKSTKTGVFQVLSKHLTATMNSDAPEDPYEMREVPWVQYFSEGYALHGAYWHDAFGQARSHGCINLSPLDARWLFHFTHPGLPQDWHGTIPNEPSAKVYVHA